MAAYLALSNVKYLLLLYRDVVLLCRHIFQWIGAEGVTTHTADGSLLNNIRIVIRCQVAGLQALRNGQWGEVRISQLALV